MKNFILLVLSLFFIVNTASANDYEEMYIIGNAVDMEFNSPGRYEMKKQENGTFKWIGFLISLDNTAGIEDSRFKFAPQKGWHPSLTCQLSIEGHTVINSGEEYQLYERLGNGEGNGHDNAFQVASSGVYEIIIDPTNLKMTCTKKEEVENVHLVGNAPMRNWAPGHDDLKMTRKDDGTYTWSGRLKSDESSENDPARFKFVFSGDWYPCLTSNIRTATKEHLMIESGEEYDLYPKQSDSDGQDNAFKVSSTGTYTVNLDLNSLTMTCVKETLDLNNLYIIGEATEAGWNLGSAIPMTRLSEGVFVWTGYLYNTDRRDFKFLSSTGEWNIGANPLEQNLEIIAGTTYDLMHRIPNVKEDYKFLVSTPGQYVITVDLNEMTMFIENAEITRSVEEDAYGTICLPMDATVENATIYEVAGVNSKESPSTLYLKETDNNEMLAGVPYIFQATEAGTVKFSYTGTDYAFEPQTANGLVGTYERVQVPADSDNYILSVGYKWYFVDSEFYSGANRAYLDLTAISVYNGEAHNARAMNFNGNDGATGIADVETENSIVDVYTIQGIKVRSQVKADEAKDGLLKGIYIINGKKEVVM